MPASLRTAVDRMKARGTFHRAVTRVCDGIPQCDLLAILGPPDRLGSCVPVTGIEFWWDYHNRLPEHVDFIVGFAGGTVRCFFTRNIPPPKRHGPFQELAELIS